MMTDLYNQRNSFKKNREFALKELIDTEKTYVNDLAEIINGFKKEIDEDNGPIPVPNDLKGGKARLVFGNIEAIYVWHRDVFLKALESSTANTKQLSSVIIKNKVKLRMYVTYAQNKPYSEHIVHTFDNYFEDLRTHLKSNLSLADMLIKPIQRMTKYEMLLKDVLKFTESAGEYEADEIQDLKNALEIMSEIPCSANLMMDAARIKHFPCNISNQGKLLLNDELACRMISNSNRRNSLNKLKKMKVFLFEQCIIFTEINRQSSFSTNSYSYIAHIQVNKMKMTDSVTAREMKFNVMSDDQQNIFVCYTDNKKLHDKWVTEIYNLLDMQKNFVEQISNPGSSSSSS